MGQFFYSLKNLILLLQSHVNLIAETFIELKDYKMQKNLSMILIFVMYSCGGDDSTSPSNESKYHSNDEAFLSQLIESGGIERDTLINRITVDSVEISGEEYDRIF